MNNLRLVSSWVSGALRSPAGPAAWNSLPTSLHEITNHKAFKRELQTILFKRGKTWRCERGSVQTRSLWTGDDGVVDDGRLTVVQGATCGGQRASEISLQ